MTFGDTMSELCTDQLILSDKLYLCSRFEMIQIVYYLLIKPLSLLPFSALYALSDFLNFLIFRVFRYRQKVVTQNLKNSFPDKSWKEIKSIRGKFYSHFFDLIVESIKLFSVAPEKINERMQVTNPEILDKYYEEGRGLVICGGHYSNWEFITTPVETQLKHQTSAIYHQFKNKFLEKIMLDSRSRSGMLMVSRKAVKEGYYDSITEPLAIIFGTDQSPTIAKKVYWTQFLNQETAVAFGAEKFAHERNSVVVWADNEKIGRGQFKVTFRVLSEEPNKEPYGRITELHTKALEEQILQKPEHWLWTHKRWKRKRKAGE